MEFFMIIDVQGPSIWALEDPGTFLTYTWGLSGFAGTLFLPCYKYTKSKLRPTSSRLELDNDACSSYAQGLAASRRIASLR